MKYFVFLLSSFVFALMMAVQPVMAQNVAGTSATMSSKLEQNEQVADSSYYTIKKMVIRRVLERYNSPLVHTIDGFVATCIKHDLDCYLLPSIAGVESTFGRFIAPNTFNPFGWGGGYIYFTSWEDGYNAVGKGLRENYINRGATDVYSIGRIYAASPTWGDKVMYFMNVFEQEEAKLLQYKVQ